MDRMRILRQFWIWLDWKEWRYSDPIGSLSRLEMDVYFTSVVTSRSLSWYGMVSPSSVTSFLMMTILTWASRSEDLRKSQTRQMRYSAPLRWVITAFLLNTNVWPRFRGTVNLAKMMPAMQAWMITPMILWVDITMIATGHSSVVALQR